MHKILDIGCGKNKVSGAIGIDFNNKTQADFIHDLNVFPYPFLDNEFDEVVCNQVLEHLDDIVKVMNEIYRISKPQAVVKIWVPHFSSADAYGDPTHKHFFSSRSLDYFVGEFPEFDYYSKQLFKKRKTLIDFWKIPKLGGIKIQKVFGIGLLANKLTSIYERFFAFIFPAQSIYFELEVIKE